MEPNVIQPGGSGTPDPGQSGQPEGDWPPRQPSVPDWQRGFVRRRSAPSQQPVLPPQYGQSNVPTVIGSTGGPRRRLSLPPKAIALIVVFGLVVVMFAVSAIFKAPAAKLLNKPKTGQGTPVSSLNDASLIAPTDMNAFLADTGTQFYHIYLTQDSTAKKACSLEFGTVSADQVQGNDLNSIVTTQTNALKKAGAKVQGPSQGDDLVMTELGGQTKYSMPTAVYQFTKDGRQVAVHYSAIAMKSGNRLAVSRQCGVSSGSLDPHAIDKIESTAQHIRVNKQ